MQLICEKAKFQLCNVTPSTRRAFPANHWKPATEFLTFWTFTTDLTRGTFKSRQAPGAELSWEAVFPRRPWSTGWPRSAWKTWSAKFWPPEAGSQLGELFCNEQKDNVKQHAGLEWRDSQVLEVTKEGCLSSVMETDYHAALPLCKMLFAKFLHITYYLSFISGKRHRHSVKLVTLKPTS